MKTPFTESKAKVSEDTRERWAKIEGWISGYVEWLLRAQLRHILLGCSRCRQDELAHLLVRRFKMLHGEAAVVMELLVEEYRLSPEGKRELHKLGQGKEPFLSHDALTGVPLPQFVPAEAIAGGITRKDVEAAIAFPAQLLQAQQAVQEAASAYRCCLLGLGIPADDNPNTGI